MEKILDIHVAEIINEWFVTPHFDKYYCTLRKNHK